jgi:hypothetical protein
MNRGAIGGHSISHAQPTFLPFYDCPQDKRRTWEIVRVPTIEPHRFGQQSAASASDLVVRSMAVFLRF